MSDSTVFRDAQPLAWLYHRNTCRWLFNTIETDDELYAPAPGKEYPAAPAVGLSGATAPPPLLALLEERASCRAFRANPLPLERLGALLHASYGTVGVSQFGALEFVDRTVPSGGALYPLELYVVVRAVDGVDPGVYHYLPVANLLEQLRDTEVPRRLMTYLFMGQPYVADAAAVIVTTAVPSRSLRKYGDRGYRYLLFEAGHVAQNINLAATALGLGSCNLGGFFDDELAGLLTLDVEHELPVYATAVGVPVGSSKTERRAITLLAADDQPSSSSS
jgi:SagB-type dehydrogenase family enzyme